MVIVAHHMDIGIDEKLSGFVLMFLLSNLIN